MIDEPDTEDRRKPNRRTVDRRRQLKQWLREHADSASVAEIVTEFGVSEATIRRDLLALSQSGDIQRVYGGAIAGSPIEFSWREKASTHAKDKTRIGVFCADKLVSAGDVVFIDSGTTPAAVARAISSRDDVTVIVGGLAALLELADGKPDVLVLGGALRRRSASFIGAHAETLIDHIRPDVAFLGTDHLDPELGANYPDLAQALFKTNIVRRAQQSWFVVDESKFQGPPRFANWTPLTAQTGIVTTRSATTERMRDVYAKRGITVEFAS